MPVPLLSPHAHLAWRDATHLLLEDPAAPHTQVVLANATPLTVRWLRSCNGSRNLEAVLAAAPGAGLDPNSAHHLIEALVATGLMTLGALPPGATQDWDPQRRSSLQQDLEALALCGRDAESALRRRQEHHISIEGTNRVAHALVEVLAASHVGSLHALARRSSRRTITLRDVGAFGPDLTDVGSVPSLALRRHIERVVPTRRERAVRPLVVACDAHLDPSDEVAYQEAGVPYLRILATSRFATIGPLTLPGHSVCWSCIALHRADGDPQWPHVLAQFDLRRRPLTPIDNTFALWVAGEAASRLLQVIDRDDPSTLVNTTFHIDREDPVLRRRTWRVHPDCACQWRLDAA